jgi:hypothetical protein
MAMNNRAAEAGRDPEHSTITARASPQDPKIPVVT